jgi:glycosyltransferase involved in cell wall biosynthesis
MKPMKIDFLIRSLGQGGAERQLVLLASGLARRGHRVRIIVFYGGGHYETEARNRGLEVLDLQKKNRWNLFPSLLRLTLLWHEDRPDLIHSYMGAANLAAAMLKPLYRRPLVWGLRASQMDLTKYDWLAQVSKWMEALFSKVADLTIANSEAGKSYASSLGFPAGRIKVVDNGFESHRWTRDAAAGRAFRQQHGLPLEDPLVGLIGRLDPAKGIEVFLEAAALMVKTHPQLNFLVVGPDPKGIQDRLKDFSKSLGISEKVYWLFGQENMVSVYSALDGLVSASLSEGFSNVLAEGMAGGLKPVTTNVGDSARVVDKWGWVVPPGDPEALANGLRAWMTDWESRGAISQLGPQAHIETTFGVDRMVTRTESLLRGALR